ncbi:MAG: hypothetical protein Ct9H300mP8_13210 [Gammaproteobacteria bacterium]|nr:MAG: hypothetical protein Ct9H300mP8_13210 [Gammaproteobacteria bacterium]
MQPCLGATGRAPLTLILGLSLRRKRDVNGAIEVDAAFRSSVPKSTPWRCIDRHQLTPVPSPRACALPTTFSLANLDVG